MISSLNLWIKRTKAARAVSAFLPSNSFHGLCAELKGKSSRKSIKSSQIIDFGAHGGEDRGGGGECIEKPITWLAFLKSSGGGGAGAHLCLNQTTMDLGLVLHCSCISAISENKAFHFIAVQGLQSYTFLG